MKKRAPDLSKSQNSKIEFETAIEAASANTVPVSILKNHLDDWVLDGKMRQQSTRTLEARAYLQKHLLWFLDRESFTVCGTSQLRAFLVHVAEGHLEPGGRWGNPKLTKPVRPATVRSYHRDLSVFFTWLVSEEVISRSPMEKIARPTVRAEQVQPFTPEQIEALVIAARKSVHPRRDEAIVLFLHDTGIRATELCLIKKHDLDLQEKRCTVIGKGNKRRVIHFGRTVSRALWHYLRENPRGDDEPLFTSDRGTRAGEPLTRSGVRQLIERLGNAANLQAVRCSPHTFRHTFAVDFLRNGGNLFSLKEMMGHSSLHMTNKYVALAQADMANQHRMFSPADRLKRGQ